MSFIKYCLFFICNTLFANGISMSTSYKKVASFTGNIAWVNSGQTQSFMIQPDLEQTYVAQSKIKMIGAFEGFLGIQKTLIPQLISQLGIDVVRATTIYLNGEIWQDGNANFNNYDYQYKLQHTHVAAKAKLFYNAYSTLTPYISASIGAGFNNAYDYYQSSKLFQVLEQPTFNNKQISSFVYTLGAGVQTPIHQYLFFNIGYEFADWGKSSLAANNNQNNSNSIHLNHFYANQLQFGLSLII